MAGSFLYGVVDAYVLGTLMIARHRHGLSNKISNKADLFLGNYRS